MQYVEGSGTMWFYRGSITIFYFGFVLAVLYRVVSQA